MKNACRIFLTYQIRQVLPGIVSAILLISLMLGVYLGSPLFKVYDQMGQPTEHRLAIITDIIHRYPVTRVNPDPSDIVWVRVGKREAVVNTHSPLFVGQKFIVDCKVGRSGTLYINHLLP